MGSPTNLSDRGAGEMAAASKMHGEPLAQLNALTRWYIISGFVLLSLLPLLMLGAELSQALTPDVVTYTGILAGAVVLFLGGIGIKFLPSSLGGNPHVYNLRMALWSYWFLLAGTAGYGLTFLVQMILSGLFFDIYFSLVSFSFFAGTGLLLYNLWKTMQHRV
ncbi:MAG: hypothetical protein ABEK50_08630 [bacterium]